MPRGQTKTPTQESAEAASDPVPEDEMLIGEQIRALRRIKGLTLQQLADQAGISIGYLSQIERNRSKLTVGILKRISNLLGIQMSWFFQPGALGPIEERNLIVRAGRRRKMSFTGTGISEELLSPNLEGPLEVLLSTIERGADSDFYSHDGAEAGLVLEGTLDLWIGDKFFRLEPGDSFAFRSTEQHRCANSGNAATKAAWIITPPHY